MIGYILGLHRASRKTALLHRDYLGERAKFRMMAEQPVPAASWALHGSAAIPVEGSACLDLLVVGII